MQDGIYNAKVNSTSLGYEDHGILTAFVHLDYSGSSQGFGGYSLDSPSIDREVSRNRLPHLACGHFIMGVLRVTKASDWESVKGCVVRARVEDGFVCALGHFMDDDWFCPKEEFKGYK